MILLIMIIVITTEKIKNYKYRINYLKEYIIDTKIYNIKDIKNKFGDVEYIIDDNEQKK